MFKPYSPSDTAPWNIHRAVHLFRRTAFGATWEEVQWSLKVGFEATLQTILAGDMPTRSPRGLAPPDSDFNTASDRLVETATAANHAGKLKVAWLYRMLYSPDPLAENMTFMWHNHFATSQLKVQDVRAMWLQNDVFRRHAREPFPAMLHEVLRDEAMLVWLDAQLNSRDAPNENLARELFELFTLGIGNYSEQDVKETARALTGRRLDDGRCWDDPQRHDATKKTILGRSGNFSPDDLVESLGRHRATSRRLAWRICEHFLGEGIATDEQLDSLADALGHHGMRPVWAVEKLLRSELFFSTRTMGQRITPPVTLVTSVVKAITGSQTTPPLAILADWIAEFGQDLFYPPNVGGWKGGQSWLSPQRWIARLRFAELIAKQPEIEQAYISLTEITQLLAGKTSFSSNDLRHVLSLPEAHVD